MPREGAWRRRAVMAAALGLALVITPGSSAWAERGGREGEPPGHSGAGNPGSSENPSKGDGNSHCAHCGSSQDPEPDPEPAPEPQPEPEPEPEPEPDNDSNADGGDRGGNPGDDRSDGSGPSGSPPSAEDAEESSPPEGTRFETSSAGELVFDLAPAPDLKLPRAASPVAAELRPHPATDLVGWSPVNLYNLPLALAIAGATALVVAGTRGVNARPPVVAGRHPDPRSSVTTLAAAARGLGGRSEYFSREDGEIGENPDDRAGSGRGDRSASWRFPGYRFTDAASATVPLLLARRSPFLARLAGDGSEFRAMFGSLWALTPIAGAVIGTLAVLHGDGAVAAPALWLLIAGAIIATFDALSGALAAAVFVLGSVLTGAVFADDGPGVVHSLLMIFAVSFLWTSLPLIGSAIRPFRRVGPRSLRYTWDRAADLTLASLLCAWIAQQMVGAMDLFLGSETGLPAHQDLVGLVVLGAVAARIAAEQLTTVYYPARLMAVEPAEPLPSPSLPSQVGGVVVRSASFAFIGYAFTGVCWQWWVGTALFFLPQVLGVMRERFATVDWVQRILPTGLVEIFILIVACTLTVRFALTFSQDELNTVRWVYLALAVPPAIIGSMAAFTDDGATARSTTWKMEVAGLGLFVVTTWLALHGWDY